MYLRRNRNRTSRRQPAPSARKLTNVQLLLETLEPRRLLTANDVSGSASLDINDPQIVVVQGDMIAPVAPVVSDSDLASFYDYNTVTSSASNTGYEVSNRITFLFHEGPDQETGFVVLVDAPQDADGGTASLDIDGLDSAVIVVADESLEQTPTSYSSLFTRTWNAQASDGAAFSNLGDNFSIDITTNYLYGIDGFDVIHGADGSRVSIPFVDQPWEIYEQYGLEISAVPEVIAENTGTLTATITRGGGVTEDLLVMLQCDASASRVTLPESVLIPAGSSTAEFSIDLIDNALPYDALSVAMTATADHFRTAGLSFDMVDDDFPLLDVGIEVALHDSNGIEASSGYLLTGTTATHVVLVTNTQNVTFSQPLVFNNNQTPDDSSDDFMLTPHRTGNDTNIGDLNNNFLFDPGEVWKFSTERAVGLGDNFSQIYCGAIDPVFDVVLSPAVSAGYFGVLPSLSLAIDEETIGEDVVAIAGNDITVNYELTNTGNTGLSDVSLSGASYVSGDTNADNVLDVDEVWTYSQTSFAAAGSQTQSADVTARDALTDTTVVTSASNTYFGAAPAIVMSQVVGVSNVLTGSSVLMEYQVGNQGNVALSDVSLSGASYVSGDTNADNVLDVDEVWTYSQTSLAAAGSQTQSADVTARDALTDTTVATSASNTYFGAAPAIVMSQVVGVSNVLTGSSVLMEYQVGNQGNVALSDVSLSGASYVSGDTNADNVLDVDEVWTYSQTSLAAAGSQTQSADVTARDALTDTTVATSASNTYFGAAPAIVMSQVVGVSNVLTGSSVLMEYQVGNQGNVALSDVSLSGASYVSGDTNADNVLDVDEVWTYSQTSFAAAGSQTQSADVTARDALTDTTVVTSASNTYFGAAPAIVMSQVVGVSNVLTGSSVLMEYQVGNQGNVALSDVSLSGASYVSGDTNADNVLDVDEVWTYSQTSLAAAGSQTQSADVTARDALTDTTVATSASNTYFGAVVDWAFDVQWADADSQNAPNLVVGESFELAYYLENLGNVELKNVEVAGAAPVYSGQTIDGDSDADGRIDPGEMWKYETLGTVEMGEQNQSVTVAAVSTVLDMPIVGFLDTSYFGEYRSLAVTSTADSGIGSLRYAIEDAASRPEGGQIYFDFSALGAELSAGKAFLIQPLSPLPALDGSSAIEILGSDHVSVVLDGSLAGSSHGLEIISDGNVVQDLTIQNFELAGIHVLGSENTISGNRIGLSVLDGEAGNGGDGIWIEAGSQNLIGGVDEDGVDQNIIAHNAGNGVAVEGGIANRIGTNAFFENAGMGIDLGRNGFTPNDSLADSGANNLISTPVITRIEIVGQTVEIDYQVPVNSAEMADSLRIEFFQADSSRREGAKFLGTDIYTVQDFVAGGKTLVVEVDEFPDFDMRIVATATSAQGNTSEFSAPSGISFTGRSVKAEQQDAVDNVADGILAKLESLLSGKTSTPALTPGQPSIVANEPVYDFVLADKVVDEILIGRNVFAQDETDCALNVGSGDDPLVMIGFGEEVDDVTMAVNDYCVEQVYDLADSLSLTPGQMVAVIWFDPINFTVSIGDNQVSYDYDNNPTELSGSIPGASLVVTSGSATTPGGVQGIMFAGDASTINVQMSTTSSGELMRGGVNIYTVGTGAGGTTIQPSIRTVFQGHLPGESVMMAFDPSAAPQLLARTGGRGSQSLAGISGADSPGGGGGGGGIPGLIPGMFSGANGFQLAFLDPASMANAALDISGSTTEAGEDGSDAEDLENQVQEEFGTEATDEREEEDETELDGREEGDEESSGEFDEAPPVEDEEEIEESISGIFDILGNALASTSGRIDVMDILTPESSTQNHQASSFTKDAEVTVARWTHNESAYDQRVSDRWATSFDAQESEKTWTEALEAARKDG